MNQTDKQAVSVQHNVAEHRFEATVDGHLCVAEYERSDGEIIFTHTYVSPELRGRGIAEKLVRTALEYARSESLRVIPQCSYVAVFVRRNREFAELLTLRTPGRQI
jgi:uncharacterized protein